MIKLAVLGCGRVAQHYKNIFSSNSLQGYNLVGFCDKDTSKSSLLASYFNTLSFSSLHQMLEKTKPDLVIILTPSGSHYEHAQECLNFGCHVLVEKPLTMLPSETEHLKNISVKKNLMLGVIFQNRLNPSIKILNEQIKTGRFGQIVTATIRLRWCRYQEYYNDGWHGTWAEDGGVINQQAIHHVDALNWLAGPIESVNAVITNRINDLEAEDTLVATIKFENGALGTIEATTAARPKDIEASLSVVGEKGIVVIGGIALNKIETWNFIDPKPEDQNIPLNYSQEVPTGYGLSHSTYLQEALNTLLNGEISPPVNAEDALKTCEIIHALYHSHENHKWVNISDKPISNKLGKK
jgi:UDP-N-acetyl-2-amino-2-deoxyglucuronate dehydrogenase